VIEREAVLRKYLKERFRGFHDDMGPQDSLENVVDSLGLFELVEFVERTFGVRVPNEEFTPRRFGSIERILATIDEMDASGSG
jgi:acyl carrier protein